MAVRLSDIEEPKAVRLSDIPNAPQRLSDIPDQGDDSLLKQGVEFLFTPLAKTITGRSLHERAVEATEPTFIKPNDPVGYWTAFTKSALGGAIGDIADMSSTPFSIISGPLLGGLGKAASKIPIRGTTLGVIAKNVPISQIFKQDVAAIASYQNALKNLAKRTAASQAPLTALRQINNPVEKVTSALKRAGKARGITANLFTAERSKRLGAIERIGKTDTGESGFIKQLSALKGELPKGEFIGIRDQLNQADVDGLYGMISKSGALDGWDKITAKRGLMKLLGEVSGQVPTTGEISMMRKVFPDAMIKTVLEKRPFLSRIGQNIADVANVPRALMTTFDASAPLRQGVFLIGRPKQWIPAFGNMFKYMFDEKAYVGLLDDIKARPTFPLMKQGKLSITDLGKKLSNREEAIMSSLPEKWPVIGKFVRGSNRAFSGFLDKLRADTFDDFIRVAQNQEVPLTRGLLEDMGSFINAATGRGNLVPALERASTALNAAFFSPRLMSSRLSLMNPAYYTKLDPFVRKEALRSLFSFAGVAGSVMGLASMGGAEVGLDPRSADFGKIKVGQTRYDILGGFQQYMRLAAQLITGEHISSTTGVRTTVGEGYKPLTRKQIIGRFVEAKEAPLLSFASSLLEGKGFAGRDLNIPEEVARRFIPMVAQDMYELSREKGPTGTAMAIPAIFGVGVQTYDATPSEIVFAARSAAKHARQLQKRGDVEGAERLLERNKDIIGLAQRLHKLQDQLSELERRRRELDKSLRISPDKKLTDKRLIDFNISEIESRMEKIVEENRGKK